MFKLPKIFNSNKKKKPALSFRLVNTFTGFEIFMRLFAIILLVSVIAVLTQIDANHGWLNISIRLMAVFSCMCVVWFLSQFLSD